MEAMTRVLISRGFLNVGHCFPGHAYLAKQFTTRLGEFLGLFI